MAAAERRIVSRAQTGNFVTASLTAVMRGPRDEAGWFGTVERHCGVSMGARSDVHSHEAYSRTTARIRQRRVRSPPRGAQILAAPRPSRRRRRRAVTSSGTSLPEMSPQHVARGRTAGFATEYRCARVTNGARGQ